MSGDEYRLLVNACVQLPGSLLQLDAGNATVPSPLSMLTVPSVRDEYRAALVASKRAQVAASSRHELLDPDEVPKAEATTSAG